MTGFLKRNPVLKTKKQFRIDSTRVNSATTDILKAQFQKLEIPAIKAIKPENYQNIDEARIIEGYGENRLVVRSTEKRFIQKKQPGSRAWTSFIKYILLTRKALHPIVMFQGKSVTKRRLTASDCLEGNRRDYNMSGNQTSGKEGGV